MRFMDLARTQLAFENNPAEMVDNRSIFARKLLKPFARLSESEILNEFRAIKKLCHEHSHENVIAVYRYGKLSDSLYYYIDMQYCDLDLAEYIHGPDTVSLLTSGRPNPLLPLHTQTVIQIMKDVSRGLTFIHEKKEIHRDIKPTNSMRPALILPFNK
jgi:serine/threonine protein kinase